jgi:uncharacterized membrane-anchored protein
MKNKSQNIWFKQLFKNKTLWLLWTIFGVSVLSKIFIIPFLGAIFFPRSDEHVYIEMAKSLYYHHNLISNVLGDIKQFNELLFPLVLSPAYLFYSSKNIITIFRIIGLLLMSSAVFPAYKLGFAVLNDQKQALLVSIIAILIPEMALSFSVVQEVLYYPLFLYTLYLIYQKISENKVNTVYLGFVLFLLLICKSIGTTVFVGYVLYLVYELAFINKFKNFKTVIVQIVILVMVVFGLKEILSLVIRYLNSGVFETVQDLSTSLVINRLIDAQKNFLNDFPNGVLYYLFYTGMAFMVFPVISVIDNLKGYSRSNQKFLLFLCASFITTVATVVVLIYMDEGGVARDVQRVHFRYIFPFIIPLIILFLKLDFSKLKLRIFGILYAFFLLFYFLLFNPEFAFGSIIDAKSLLLVGYINNLIVNAPHFLALFILMILIYVGYLLYKESDRKKSRKIIICTMVLFLLINQAFAILKTYWYYTSETNGIERKSEYSLLSDLANSSPGSPIVINTGDPNWINLLNSTQSNKDYIYLYSVDNRLEYSYDLTNKPNYIITPKNMPFALKDVNYVNTGLKLFDVYQLKDSSTGKIKFDYVISNIYSDLWLMDNAKLNISGDQRGNQIEVKLDLMTDSHAGVIFADFTDSTGKKTSVQVGPNGTATVNLLVNKNPDEDNFELKLGSDGFFVPATMPDVFGSNNDVRKLTYKITGIVIK